MAASASSPPTLSWPSAPSTGAEPPAPTVALTPEITGFTLHQELGRGGMGVVYQATDQHLGRPVAVKMLLAGVADPVRLERFKVESAALAKLSHPHILTVYQAGLTTQGQPFLVTELVPGGSLAQKIAHQPQDPEDSARLLLVLARAVQAAHQAGILHRDLKPGNVLLAPAASEPALNCVWGWPKLADFGLAKFLEADHPGATRTGQIMGSPPYMAPEQVIGDTAAIGPATDIYGLGAILYELLTGRPPYPNFFRDKLPVPPRELRPELSPALEGICLKCLALAPQERYSSIGVLIDALQAYLGGMALPETRSFAPNRAVVSRRRPWRWVVGGVAGVISLGLLGLAFLRDHPKTESAPAAAATPLTGELEVRLWSDSKRGQRVQEFGVLPARAGEQMQIQARLNAPAYLYLVLIDSQGNAVPLSPWNAGSRLTARTFFPLPGELQPVAEVRSPPEDGRGWRLDKNAGLETVLLLARRTPLETDLGPLLAGLPPAKLRHAEELLERTYDAQGNLQRPLDQHRGIGDEAEQIDEPLLHLLQRLRPHFEVIRALRFAHQGN